jgi:hypothetical protein
MSDVRVTIGANSAPLQSEFDKVKQSAGKLKQSVGEAGGVLEGDRRVENKMTAWVEGFKSAQNGADLLANTMGNLGDVFKSSLAIGVGLNVGAALVGMISDVIKESDELRKSAKAAGDELHAALTTGDSGALESAIKKANEELGKLAKKASGIFTGTSGADKSKLFDEKLLAGSELIKLAKDELEIQKLIAEEEWDKADALAEDVRLAKERAKIRSLNLPMFQHNALVSTSNESSELRLEAKREEHRKDQAQKDEQAAKEAANQAAKAEEAVKKAMDAAEKLRLGFIISITEAEIAAMRETAKVQEQKNAEKIKQELAANEKMIKAKADQEKAALESERDRKQGDLKKAENVIEKGKQEQKQRDDKAVQGILAGESLPEQRQKEKVEAAAKDKAAGIAARDEVRRKYGGDANKMTKAEIDAVKNRILGEKQIDQKQIAAAARAIPEIQQAINKLVAKLGVK